MDTKNSIQNSHRLKESEVSFFKHIDINMVGSTKGSSSFLLLGEIDFSIDCRSSWSFANSWRTIEKKVAFATVADLYYEIPSLFKTSIPWLHDSSIFLLVISCALREREHVFWGWSSQEFFGPVKGGFEIQQFSWTLDQQSGVIKLPKLGESN